MSVWDDDDFEGYWLGFVFDWKRLQNLEKGERRESATLGSLYGRTYGNGVTATTSRPSPSEGHA